MKTEEVKRAEPREGMTDQREKEQPVHQITHSVNTWPSHLRTAGVDRPIPRPVRESRRQSLRGEWRTNGAGCSAQRCTVIWISLRNFTGCPLNVEG
jgi:hypothetical protein